MTTAVFSDKRHSGHTEIGHVERAERLNAILKAIQRSSLKEILPIQTPRSATLAELALAHNPAYLQQLQRISEQGGGWIDADTYMTEASWEAAIYAAGAAIQSVEAVMSGAANNAFALVRPPGHHATRQRAMGFCLINNIAVAAYAALEQFGLERVAIVDFDVHHGNGTQDIFYDEPRVLFCSTHAAPYYPGTGALGEVGAGAAHGTTFNLPLPFSVGDRGYMQAFSSVLIPALRHWRPQMILVSAGYDAHWSDPIGPMVLSVDGYTELTRQLYNLAAEICDGRLVMVLEGGYNLEALGACTVAALHVLLDRAPEPDGIGLINSPEPDLTRLFGVLQQRHPLLKG